MFVDYYSLFEIPQTSTADEIKSAFRTQALKWHPDRNPGVDTTQKMQLLNEAKLILLDTEAREKYDIQYLKFKQFEETKRQSTRQEQTKEKAEEPKQQTHKPFEKTYTHTDFDVDDDILKRWTTNAKKQSVDLAKQTIEELKGMTKAGVKAGAKAMGNAFIYQIILSVVILIIFGLAKSCN